MSQQLSTRSPLAILLTMVSLVSILLAGLAYDRAYSGASVGTGGDTELVGEADLPTPTVDVELSEFAFTPEPITIAPEGVLQVSNVGSAEHNLKIEGMEEAYATADLTAGDVEALSLGGLEPGEYPIYCTIAGHAEAGMTGTLVVDANAPVDVAEADGDTAGEGEAGGGEVEGDSLTGMERAEWLRANYEASVSQFPAETEAMGNQRMEPEILSDGTKVFELTIDETQWEVAPGEFVEAVAYNGQVPGPWIHTEVGDRITIRVINELDSEGTTLHPHGIFRHPFEVDGVGMISMDPIMPGETWEQTFVTQETSVGMYHGHDNGVHQVINGAFGAFTVGQVPLPPQADNVVAEDVMILNDAGEIGLTLNAKSFPATQPYVLTEGEQMILHYYNEGLTPHPMHLHNNAQMVIAKDGYPLASPIVMDTVNVAPGERYTVVIFAEAPGTWVYHCHILSHVERDDGSVFGMFTALIVEPSDDPDVNSDLDRDLGRDQIPVFPGQSAVQSDQTGQTEQPDQADQTEQPDQADQAESPPQEPADDAV
ncbi:multicopper oxidase domain-containing protein [Euzebya tangerina]|uniref:multicopper oxidase domain-containing protein n=1 Tax=Euzebya tangerina TaxID=591198 RepID=UPI000E31B5BC|nr:multicopper oxidase domain-containing protein [Euzebya tangerina]